MYLPRGKNLIKLLLHPGGKSGRRHGVVGYLKVWVVFGYRRCYRNSSFIFYFWKWTLLMVLWQKTKMDRDTDLVTSNALSRPPNSPNTALEQWVLSRCTCLCLYGFCFQISLSSSSSWDYFFFPLTHRRSPPYTTQDLAARNEVAKGQAVW